MRSLQAIIEAAKSGTATHSELARLADELRSNKAAHRHHEILHALGHSNAVHIRSVVELFLERRDDPMLVRAALQVLCGAWGLRSEYRHLIVEFARGQEWDDGDDVRLLALSQAGEALKERADSELLEVLEDAQSTARSQAVREAAGAALLRAAGRSHTEIFELELSPDRWRAAVEGASRALHLGKE